ncbi:hypothetical protein HJC23_000504 [Cyclotella cryptica]|uniref:Uncharacterized protein n=1 Tax=Cyclotella cryptica TaxID=29204 RepID=A0ABD3NUE1_9STRA|eukprot:CCRYP_020131-RA/>CCRYP_020131-RA protein AED:0.02 eAED:0.02 QI:162/1/1/1/1/1/2/1809/283
MTTRTMTIIQVFVSLQCILLFISTKADAFCPIPRIQTRQRIVSFAGFAKDNEASSKSEKNEKKRKGDSVRSTTGIRPSLHPVTINCVAEALLLRSKHCLLPEESTGIAIDIANSQTEPLQIAITAGGIALNAIEQRKSAAETDDTTEVFTMEEANTISGRVVGVVMRMRELERILRATVIQSNWVRKYGEEESFGCLRSECLHVETSEGATSSGMVLKDDLEKQLAETIKMNPLFRMNRAECLLALFLDTVERPKLEMLGESVPGGSKVDFIDADRLEVLLKT